MSLSVIILAAGKGSRMKKNENKVYIELNSKKVIDYSLRVFDSLDYVDEIICVYASGEKRLIEERVRLNVQNKATKLVLGGKERKDSVSNALKVISRQSAYFAIHDGARPLIDRVLMDHLYEKVIELDAIIPVIQVKDTIKEVKNLAVTKTLNRKALVAVQTPQLFNSEYKNLIIDNDDNKTDDASYIEGSFPVFTTKGSEYNIKLTTPVDIWLAEAILRKVDKFNW